jgi:hypothetical protein
MQEMRRSKSVFFEVQAWTRDAVRVPLSSMRKRVVNFRDSEGAPTRGSSHDNTSSPRQNHCPSVIIVPDRYPELPTSKPVATLRPRHGLPITQCSHCDRQWQWNHQSWIRRRGCAKMLFPVIRRTTEACADNGRRIGGRCIHRTTSTTI